MGVTWVLEEVEPPLTMKHVSSYGTMERDTQTSIGRRGESWTDSSGDRDALADVEKDPGAQSAAGLSATTTPVPTRNSIRIGSVAFPAVGRQIRDQR